MLVFACGLLAAIGAVAQRRVPAEVARGRAIERPLQGQQQAGPGYEAMGQAFRGPKTGKPTPIER